VTNGDPGKDGRDATGGRSQAFLGAGITVWGGGNAGGLEVEEDLGGRKMVKKD